MDMNAYALEFKGMSILLSYLHANYPGGLDQFVLDGGLVTNLPGEILIHIPKDVEFLKEKLTEVGKQLRIKVTYCTGLNFAGVESEDAKRICVELFNKIAETLPDLKFAPICAGALDIPIVIVEMPSDEDLRMMRDLIESTEGIVRYHLIHGGQVVVAYDSSLQSRITPETPKRATAIDGIDIGCLTRKLEEVATVEDFLKSF